MRTSEREHGGAWQVEVLRQIGRAGRYLDWQLSFLLPHVGRRVLELGCGTGLVTRRLLARGADVTAVDGSAEALAIARQELGAAARWLLGRLEEEKTWAELAGPYDSVVAVNVLEHIEDDALLLRRAAARLAPDGAVLLLVPACPCLFGSADRIAGHRRRYTATRLNRLLTECGFTVENTAYFNRLGAIGWWLRFVMRGAEDFSSSEIGVMDRITPWWRRIDPLVALPFGLSLAARGRRR